MIHRMTRLPNLPTTVPVALLLLSLAASWPALAGAGKAYKCVVDGKTVYQDHPCVDATPAPAATVATPAPAIIPPPKRSAVQVFDEIQMVQRHQRELVEAYKREAELAGPRLATMAVPARNLETQQMQARWLPRIRAERQHLERLQAEIRAQCPGGASMREGRFQCDR
jgi:hypothetical protein